eukprot:jgi/Bigna1/128401/aug1.6_g3109
MDVKNYKYFDQFRIKTPGGAFKSFEREWYDMVRSTFLKYNFQVRIGAMDGVIIAFHNTRSVLGYQYVPLSVIDYFLYGGSEVADMMFSVGVQSLDKILTDVVTEFHDYESLIVTFNAGDHLHDIDIYVESVPADRSQRLRDIAEWHKLKDDEETYEKLQLMAATPHWTEVDGMSEEVLTDELTKNGLDVDGVEKDRKARLEGKIMQTLDGLVPPKAYYEDLEEEGYLKRYAFRMASYHNGRLVHDPLKLTCKKDNICSYIQVDPHKLAAAGAYHSHMAKKAEQDEHKLKVNRFTLDEGADSQHPPKVEYAEARRKKFGHKETGKGGTKKKREVAAAKENEQLGFMRNLANRYIH